MTPAVFLRRVSGLRFIELYQIPEIQSRGRCKLTEISKQKKANSEKEKSRANKGNNLLFYIKIQNIAGTR